MTLQLNKKATEALYKAVMNVDEKKLELFTDAEIEIMISITQQLNNELEG